MISRAAERSIMLPWKFDQENQSHLIGFIEVVLLLKFRIIVEFFNILLKLQVFEN